MSKEEGTQIQETEPTSSAPNTEPTETPAPQATPPELPPELQGKTPSELADMYQKSQSHISTLEGENKGLREDAGNFERLQQQEHQRQQQTQAPYDNYGQPSYPQQPQYQQPLQPEFNYEKPIETIDGRIGQALAYNNQMIQQQRMQDHQQQTRFNFEQGFNRAKESNPELYNGIENSVKETMFQLANGMGTNMPPQTLLDSTMWDKIAVTQRYERNEVDKISRRGKPMQSVQTETPQGSSPNVNQPPQYDKATIAEAEKFGVTKEEYEENIRLGRETILASKSGG